MKTIRALRQERGEAQFELALRVGVQPPAVSLWERGRRLPQAPQRRKLGQVFGLCSDDIDLESIGAEARRAPASDQPRAARRLGERAPGRDQAGRPVIRGRESDSAP